MQLYFKEMKSPVGHLKLVAHDQALVAVLWENEKLNRVKLAELKQDYSHPILQKTEQQLLEYFSGQRKIFDLALDFYGTEFQKSVWNALLQIPFGETRSYKQIAESIGNVKAVRAVGAANGKNPISIIAPCHRVIGVNGKLVGFAGGLENKNILLSLESK
ncbi:glycosyltransferase [Acinetobacter sp. Ac_877]|uniref:methylated-DNA--[protein]-cysteine S-methyltransferase n=1 Tax=Acinetobacter portensis TaxID=1839785 RepID=UPI00128BA3FF|nr:methylated-DNA--[protein]-cysteine S-methyltransferase [Acinetobacter portensis]MPW42220.1 glycosyltransferase [Acinetobacter portensis]